MKNKIVLIFLLATFATLTINAQMLLPDGDACFEKGNYTCALSNYQEAYKVDDGSLKQVIQKKIDQAKLCLDNIKAADRAFNLGSFLDAKTNYQKVVLVNPNDTYAKNRIEICEQRLNSPSTTNTTLSVSIKTLNFPKYGGTQTITVNTDASDYSITGLPPWCTVHKYSNSFVVVCNKNQGDNIRSYDFKVTANDKTEKIVIIQSGSTQSSSFKTKTSRPTYKSYNCFNCPKTNDVFGLSVGYLQNNKKYFEGYQIGLRIEPLFKYGFGLNTGLNFEAYKAPNDVEFSLYSINLPIHLQYRFNFSKWFNVFAYGGTGIHFVFSSEYEESVTPIVAALEYGAGIRVNRIQFTAGISEFYMNLGDNSSPMQLLYNEVCERWGITLSYMF